MRYLFAIVVPPIATAIWGSRRQFLLNVLLTLALVLPGIIHAVRVVRRHRQERSRRRSSRTATTAAAASTATAAWRSGDRETETVRHGWQREWTSRPLRQLRRRDRRRSLRVRALWMIGMGLLGLLLYWILYAPVKTPLVYATATDYSWPMPPNAWAQEDLRHLSQLDGETLKVQDTSAAWESKELGLKELERQLRWASQNRAGNDTVVICVSMHGAVDGTGRPCLIPPGASPLHSETWLPVQELLDRIGRELPAQVNKLLLLDCNRQLVNWTWGLLYNGFADQLSETVERAKIANLVVLNSTSPGQIGWTAPDVQSSVFGHYVRLGLAGAADGARYGGNGDGRVSLYELHDYVATHIDRWSVHHRGTHQQPMLIPKDAPNFEIVRALNRQAWQELVEVSEGAHFRNPPVNESDLTDLWKAHDRLLAYEPYRFDPLVWRDFQHKLLWLEACNQAGSAYDRSARQLSAELKQFVARVDQRIEQRKGSTSVWSNVFSQRIDMPADEVDAHSVALAQLLGKVEPLQATQLRDALLKFEQAPTKDNLAAALEIFHKSQPASQYCEGHFLRLIDRHQLPDLWSDSNVLGRAAAVRRRGEQWAAGMDASGNLRDLRALAWAVPTIDSGDSKRRLAEDVLFAGQGLSDADAGALLAQAEATYQAAGALLTNAGAAFRTRDELLGQIPFVAQWLARPLAEGQDVKFWDEQVNQQLLPLIFDIRRLAKAVAGFDALENTSARPGLLPLDESSGMQQRFDELMGVYQSECERLLDEPVPDATSMRSIDSLLAMPWVPWEKRAKLWQLRDEIAGELRASFGANNGPQHSRNEPQSEDQESVDERPDYLARAEQIWQFHPVLAMFEQDEVAGSRPRTSGGLTSESEKVRQLLATVAERTEADPGQAEQIIREAAAFLFRPPPNDPIAVTRRRVLQNLLVWHCRRALDDFLGPAQDDETPFFVTASEDYLLAARTIVPPTAPVQRQIDELEKLLDQRRRAAANGIAIAATDILMVDPAASASTTCVVRAKDETAAAFPQARLAVFLRDQAERLGGAVGSVQLPLSQDGEAGADVEIPFTFEGEKLLGRGPYLDAVGLLRGNLFTQPLLLRVADGVRVEVVRQGYGPATVTLKGRRHKQASVVFVLDCSSSMGEPIDVATANGNRPARRTRLEMARRSLRGMLASLASRSDVRVGMRFFGHRVGWDTQSPNRLLRQYDYAHEIPLELRPHADVELVLPIGRFDDRTAERISQLLATVKPWGESPLYLSLMQALSDFDSDDPNTEQNIVVITDGLNNQFNPPPETAKTLADVLAARGEKDIRIFVLGFGIPASEAAAARREFSMLTERTGGRYVEAAEAATLLESLESLLRPNMYQVVDARSQVNLETQVGATVVVGSIPEDGKKFWVVTDSLREEIELAGGEAVDMLVDYETDEIVVPDYRTGSPRFAPLSDKGANSSYRVGLHRAVFDGRGASFPLSIQRADQRFTKRPAEIWVEITPRAADSDRSFMKYIFYDAIYEPDLPVPLVRLYADDWPAEAKEASVRVWLKWENTRPTETVKLGQVANQPPLNDNGFPLKTVPGVSYQVRMSPNTDGTSGVRVKVVEHHASGSPGVGSLKVDIDPPARRVLRQFDAKNGVALHTFEFPETGDQVADHRIQFTRRRDLQTDCWQLNNPTIVNIYQQGDVIRLTPAGIR